MTETKYRKCQFVDKPCNDRAEFECEPLPWQKGKPCFPTTEEYVAHYLRMNPHVTENQIRRWYASGRRFQISMYRDEPLTEEDT